MIPVYELHLLYIKTGMDIGTVCIHEGPHLHIRSRKVYTLIGS